MTNWTTVKNTTGAILRMLRRIEAVAEQLRDASPSTRVKPELLAAYDETNVDQLKAETNCIVYLDNAIVSAIQTAHRNLQAQIEKPVDWFGVLDAELQTSQTDKAAGAIKHLYDTSDSLGAVTILNRQGRLAALRAAMIAAGSSVQENAVTVGSFTSMPGNVGVLVSSVASGADYSFSGTAIITFTDDTFPRKYKVELNFAKPLANGAMVRTGDTTVRGTVGQSFAEGQTGLTITVDYDDPTETGDTYAILSGTTVSGVNGTDTDLGVWYTPIDHYQTAGTDYIRIRWYADSAQTDLRQTTLVSGGWTSGVVSTGITAADGMFMLTHVNMTNAIANLPNPGDADLDIVFDAQIPRNGDRWKFTVTNNEGGNYATKIGKRWPVDLPSNGAPSWSDALASSVSFS